MISHEELNRDTWTGSQSNLLIKYELTYDNARFSEHTRVKGKQTEDKQNVDTGEGKTIG